MGTTTWGRRMRDNPRLREVSPTGTCWWARWLLGQRSFKGSRLGREREDGKQVRALQREQPFERLPIRQPPRPPGGIVKLALRIDSKPPQHGGGKIGG